MKTVVRVVDRCYFSVGAGSKLITILPFREFSHVSRLFHYSDGTAEETESIQGKGVCWHEPTVGRRFEAYDKGLDHDQMQALYAFMLTIKGKYDWTGILGFIIRGIKQNPFMWFYTEYLAYCDFKMGRPVSRKDPYKETPQSYRDSLAIGKRSVDDEDPNVV